MPAPARGLYELALLSVSQAYGCTEPYFLIREAFQRRTAMFRYDEFRRPSLFMLDVNFAKTTPITDRIRLQVRLEAFNLLNSPQYDERQYNQTTSSADFGRINRNTTGQSGFQRFVQVGFRLISSMAALQGRPQTRGGADGLPGVPRRPPRTFRCPKHSPQPRRFILTRQ